MRWWPLALLALPVAALAHPFPRTAALPGWTGLTEVAPGLWSGPGAPPGVAADVAAADAQVRAFWGEGPGPHRTIVCTDAACDAALGGVTSSGPSGGDGPLAQAFGPWLLVTYSRLLAQDEALRRAILAHEMSHLVLAGRVSPLRLWSGEVPAWLNEGVAVLASDDPRFDLTPDVCARLAEVDLPVTMPDWSREAATRERPLYQAAACRARDWLARNGLDAIGREP